MLLKKLTFILLALFVSFSNPPDKNKISEITFIANDGFLIEDNGKKILVDALFNCNLSHEVTTPSEKVLNSIINGVDLFSNLNFLLITHSHPDHFSPVCVIKCLLQNPKLKLICPRQVEDSLKLFKNDFQKIKNQIITIKPKNNSFVVEELNGVKITVLGLTHIPFITMDSQTGKIYNINENIENLGFLIETGENVFLHLGDSMLSLHDKFFSSLKLNQLKVAYLFLSHLDVSLTSQSIAFSKIKPKFIVYMHLPPNANFANEILANLVNYTQKPIIFKNELQQVSFE